MATFDNQFQPISNPLPQYNAHITRNSYEFMNHCNFFKKKELKQFQSPQSLSVHYLRDATVSPRVIYSKNKIKKKDQKTIHFES